MNFEQAFIDELTKVAFLGLQSPTRMRRTAISLMAKSPFGLKLLGKPGRLSLRQKESLGKYISERLKSGNIGVASIKL